MGTGLSPTWLSVAPEGGREKGGGELCAVSPCGLRAHVHVSELAEHLRCLGPGGWSQGSFEKQSKKRSEKKATQRRDTRDQKDPTLFKARSRKRSVRAIWRWPWVATGTLPHTQQLQQWESWAGVLQALPRAAVWCPMQAGSCVAVESMCTQTCLLPLFHFFSQCQL